MPPKIKIEGKTSNFKQKDKNAVVEKSSQFFLTINTNQPYKPNDAHIEADTEIFTDVIKDFLANLKDHLKLSAGDTYDDNINDIGCQYVIELGTKKLCLHSHIFLKFRHSCKDLKLNYTSIKTKIASDLGLQKIFFNCRMVSDNDTNVLNYIEKYVK